VVDHVWPGIPGFDGDLGKPQRVHLGTDGGLDGQPCQIHNSLLDLPYRLVDMMLGEVKTPFFFAVRGCGIVSTVTSGEESGYLIVGDLGRQHTTGNGMSVPCECWQHQPG
jgi:hypothetical protein